MLSEVCPFRLVCCILLHLRIHHKKNFNNGHYKNLYWNGNWRGGVNWTIAVNLFRLHIFVCDSLELSRIQFTLPTVLSGLACRCELGITGSDMWTPFPMFSSDLEC